MPDTDDQLTDKQLELTVRGASVRVRLWQNPATAAGVVAYRTWRIDGGEQGRQLEIQMVTVAPEGAERARFWVGSRLGDWGNGQDNLRWETGFPLFPVGAAGDWKPYDVHPGGLTTIQMPASPFLVVLATDGGEEARAAASDGDASPVPDGHTSERVTRAWDKQKDEFVRKPFEVVKNGGRFEKV